MILLMSKILTVSYQKTNNEITVKENNCPKNTSNQNNMYGGCKVARIAHFKQSFLSQDFP